MSMLLRQCVYAVVFVVVASGIPSSDSMAEAPRQGKRANARQAAKSTIPKKLTGSKEMLRQAKKYTIPANSKGTKQSASPKITRFDWYGPNYMDPVDPFRLYPGEELEFTLEIQGPQYQDVVVQLNSSNQSAVPVPSSVTVPKEPAGLNLWRKKFTITIPNSVNPPKTSSVTASTTAGTKVSMVSVQEEPES